MLRTARAPAQQIKNLCLECIPHLAYSPSDGKKFSTEEEIKEAGGQSEDSSSQGIQAVMSTRPTVNVLGTMLKTDKMFSMLCVCFLQIKKKKCGYVFSHPCKENKKLVNNFIQAKKKKTS